MKTYYKLAQPVGFDFYSGKTINYRENIGKTVIVPNYNPKVKPILCTATVLHASLNPNDAFIGAKIPCSVYRVQGKPVVKDSQKCGFRRLNIIEEVDDENLDALFGWKYHEVCNPINPLKIVAPKIGDTQLLLLRNWASLRDSIGASVRDSIGASVRDSVGTSVWDSVGTSVWDLVGTSLRDSVWASVRDSVGTSVWDSVWASLRDSIGASVWDSVWAYIGSLFPNIKTWKCAPVNIQGYPYQSCVDLWRQGIFPSFDGSTWRLHTNIDARIAYKISKEKLEQLPKKEKK